MKKRNRFLVLLALLLAISAMPLSVAQDIKELFQLGLKHIEKGETDLAIETFQQVVLMAPDFAEAYNLLGLAYLRKTESEDSAIRYLEQAVKLKPEFQAAYENLGSAYSSQGVDLETALKYYEKSIELNPNAGRSYAGAAWIYLYKRGDARKAADYFEKAVFHDPASSEALYGLGISQVGMGKRALALKSISLLRAIGSNKLALDLESLLKGKKKEVGGDSIHAAIDAA